jgi:hypothetical protein
MAESLHVSFKNDPETLEKLEEAAKEKTVGTSTLARMIIQEYFKS